MMIHEKKFTDKTAQNKESVVEFIWEILCCMLIGVGTSYLVDAQFPMQTGLMTIVWHVTLTLTVISLITRRWWLLIGTLGLSVLGIFGWLTLTGNLSVALQNIEGFFGWWFSNLPQDSVWFTEENIATVHFLSHIGISIGFFTLLRITRRAWPTLIACIVVMVVVMIFGQAVNNSVAVAFYAAGIFPLFAKEHFSGRVLFVRRNKLSILGKRWVVVTVSGVLCILAALGAFFLLPYDTKDVRTRFCSYVTADLQTATEFYTTEQREAINISLYDLGLQYRPQYIGGNLKPIDSSVIAITDSTEPLLLKVTSYDVYDGIRWKNSFAKNYRINGIWQEEEIKYLSGPITEDEAWMDKIFKFTELKDVTITMTHAGNILGTVGQTIAVTQNTKTKNPILFNEKGELFSYFQLPKGYSYTLSYLSYPTKTDIGEKNNITMLGAASVGTDPLYDNPEFYNHYTALPKEYSRVGEELVGELIPEGIGVYEAAWTISDHFSNQNGYYYTNFPGWITAGENVVDKLLEEKKGHCGYYATTMITMARAMGIPSRLAAGYKTVDSADGKYQVVDVASPYCWVECYIKNIGWVSFDPTPKKRSLKPTNNNITDIVDSEIIEEDPDDFEDDDDEAPDVVEPGEPTYSTYKFPIVKFLIIIGISIAAILLLRSILAPLVYSKGITKILFRNKKKRIIYYYRDILRQLSILGFKLKKGETLNELIERLDTPIDEKLKLRIEKELNVIERMQYNEETPTDEEIDAIITLRKMLNKKILKSRKIFVFILRRKMFIPIINLVIF